MAYTKNKSKKSVFKALTGMAKSIQPDKGPGAQLRNATFGDEGPLSLAKGLGFGNEVPQGLENMEDMLESRRGSIINMIRGAANEHGQDFLEMIDTDTYNEEQRAAGGPTRSYE